MLGVVSDRATAVIGKPMELQQKRKILICLSCILYRERIHSGTTYINADKETNTVPNTIKFLL